jgi:Sap, sulfolipid-1-addressing protein
VLGNGVDPDTESGIEWLKVAVGIVFLVMAAQQWRKRPRDGEIVEMPKWTDSVASITAPRAATLGFSGANPKNLALTLAASASISEAGLDRADTALAQGGQPGHSQQLGSPCRRTAR